MAAPHEKLNRGAKTGADSAAEHLDALTKVYGRSLRAAGRRAAERFRQIETIRAAALPNEPPSWTPPLTGSLIDSTELAADTQRKTSRIHGRMLAAAATPALEPFGIRFDITAPTSKALLDAVAQRIQTGISAAIEAQIAEAIRDGYAAGHSVSTVSRAIQKATDAISRPRADMLARTDLNALSNGGSLLAASISGAASTKTWLSAGDERVRPDHEDADGQTVAIDDTFDVGGESAMYPGDPQLSDDESCNCRCTLVYGQPLTASADGSDLGSEERGAKLGVTVDPQPPIRSRFSTGSSQTSSDESLRLTNVVTSGGNVTGIKINPFRPVTPRYDLVDLTTLTISERAELQAALAEPLSPEAERMARVRDSLKAAGLAATFDDDELAAVLVAFDALSTARHAYSGTGGLCALCGQPMSAYVHLGTIVASSDEAALLAAVSGGTPWQATLCVEGEPTIDSGVKRVLTEGSITWLPLPLPLMLMDDGPHADVVTKAPICGRIDQIWKAGNVVQGAGVFFDDSSDPTVAEAGAKAAALVSEMKRMGISVDLADADWDAMEYSGGTVTEIGEGDDFDEANDPTARNYDATNDLPTEDEVDVDDPEIVMACMSASIAGATIVPVAALAPNANISLIASGWFEEPALTAAAAGIAPLEPSRDWFDNPRLHGPTPQTVTDEGRYYGHLALWETCHTGKPGQCVTAPRSPTEYASFHRGELKTVEGDLIPVGVLTMNTGHAGLRMSAAGTVAHYDDTGTVAAHVCAGEDEYGIWLAGAVNPKLAAEDVRLLRAAPPSGDWRNTGDGLDLFAALAVNGPGFPVPRARLVASGAEEHVEALVAAGVLPVADCAPCEESFARELAVLAASADGIEGLAALVEA